MGQMDARVKDYLESKNPSTREGYRRGFALFEQYTASELGRALSGTELIRRIAADRRRKIEDRRRPEIKLLKGFYEWLRDEAPQKGGKKKGFAPKTIHKYISGVCEFLNFNDLPLSRKKLNIPRPTRKSENRKMNIRKEQVEILVNHAKTNRDRALIICMWQSGMGIGDLLSLNVGAVMVKDPVGGSLDDPPLLVKLVREKTKIDYRTFFGADACEALKRYLAERERTQGKLDRRDPLFTQTRKRKGKYERLGGDAGAMVLRRVVERSGLVDVDQLGEGDLNPARPHALRAGFSSVLKEEGVNQSVIDGLTGHAVSYDSAYHNFTDKQLRDLYRNHESVLSVSAVSIPGEGEIEEVVKRHFGELGVERVMPELRKSVRDLSSHVSKIEREIKRREVLSTELLAEAIKDPKVRSVLESKIRKIVSERMSKVSNT